MCDFSEGKWKMCAVCAHVFLFNKPLSCFSMTDPETAASI